MSVVILSILLVAVLADVRGCVCDPALPGTLEARECALTRIAVEEKIGARVLFKADASPTKPNRWLAIPHALRRTLNDMTPAERTDYWTAAIAKAHELWGDAWGIAVNGEERRSQCQMHAHIGKLLADADSSGGVLVDGPGDIPLPERGAGIWIAPEGAKLRAHVGAIVNETVLMR